MRAKILGKLQRHPQLVAFLLAVFALGVSNGVFQTTYNNYLNDVFEISATQRGALEFPREFPGFLVALLAGALFFLAENRVAALAAIFTGLGMIGLGMIDQSWAALLVFTVIWSIGQHVEMPMRSALAMSLGSQRQHGRRLGQTSAARIAANIVGAVFVWVIIDHVARNYLITFFFGGAAAIIGGLFYYRLRFEQRRRPRGKLVVRREYSLYYVLCTLFGARKQIFITFAPWVLVTIYGEPASTFAKLWVASAIIGVFFQQGLGDLIDNWGERKVLITDGVVVLLICLGYAFADRIGLPPGWPVRVLYACYVIDQLLMGIENARCAYIAKIARQPEDVSPSLALGITLNHAVAMLVPFIGGKYVWDVYGYEWVFIGGAGISVLTIIAANQVRTPPGEAETAPSQPIEPQAQASPEIGGEEGDCELR